MSHTKRQQTDSNIHLSSLDHRIHLLRFALAIQLMHCDDQATTHEEADVIIVQQLQMDRVGTKVTIVSDDTKVTIVSDDTIVFAIVFV